MVVSIFHKNKQTLRYSLPVCLKYPPSVQQYNRIIVTVDFYLQPHPRSLQDKLVNDNPRSFIGKGDSDGFHQFMTDLQSVVNGHWLILSYTKERKANKHSNVKY